jgi:16S rRNA (uracil1498-N3)-methyltransferase
MRISRIYTSQPLASGQNLELEERAARYLLQVLRMRTGRELILFNGDGNDYQATITEAGRRQLYCEIGERLKKTEVESSLSIELGIGVSKGDRMDLVIQKATELGVARIAPLFTERVDVKLQGDREAKKLQHWQQILISACEQSGRSVLPELLPPQSLADWLPRSGASLDVVLCPARSQELALTLPESRKLRLLVGPEGGLSDEEIDTAIAGGFQAMQLGPRVLRTETAPLAAMSILQHRFGDMGWD